MPELPVATAFWTPKPDLYKGAEAWILAGGAHHTAFSYDLSVDQMVAWQRPWELRVLSLMRIQISEY